MFHTSLKYKVHSIRSQLLGFQTFSVVYLWRRPLQLEFQLARMRLFSGLVSQWLPCVVTTKKSCVWCCFIVIYDDSIVKLLLVNLRCCFYTLVCALWSANHPVGPLTQIWDSLNCTSILCSSTSRLHKTVIFTENAAALRANRRQHFIENAPQGGFLLKMLPVWILLNTQKWNTTVSPQGPTLPISVAHLECCLNFSLLGQPFAQCYNIVTALPMHPSKDAQCASGYPLLLFLPSGIKVTGPHQVGKSNTASFYVMASQSICLDKNAFE